MSTSNKPITLKNGQEIHLQNGHLFIDDDGLKTVSCYKDGPAIYETLASDREEIEQLKETFAYYTQNLEPHIEFRAMLEEAQHLDHMDPELAKSAKILLGALTDVYSDAIQPTNQSTTGESAS